MIGGVEATKAPRHCSPDRDCLLWARHHAGAADSTEHADADSATRTASVALRAWLTATADEMIQDDTIGDFRLRHPEPARQAFSSGLVDGATMHLLISKAQRAEQRANALYVGLIAQELTARWIGLAGFFLPACTECQDLSTEAHEDWIARHLLDAGLTQISLQQLPPGARPSPGWFDGGRLRMAFTASSGDTAAWCPWPPRQTSLPLGLLVRVAPTITELSGVVICDSLEEALHLPMLLGAAPDTVRSWTWRAGAAPALELAVGWRGDYTVEGSSLSPAQVSWAAAVVDNQQGMGAECAPSRDLAKVSLSQADAAAAAGTSAPFLRGVLGSSAVRFRTLQGLGRP